MARLIKSIVLLITLTALSTTPAHSQNTSSRPFEAGEPLNLSANARTYGGFRFAESMSYDAERDLYVAVNAGMPQDVIPNDGYVSLLNPDGTVHTLKWIGVNRDGLMLNHPLGSDIINGRLYVADINVVRWFDMETGEPQGSVTVAAALRFNDIEVAEDGTIYASQTGTEDPASWRIYRVTPQGASSVFVADPVLARPNGIAFDGRGNIVVVTVLSNDVLTYAPDGTLLNTEHTVDPGNDGLVIVDDGTKYVSSVRAGTVSRIRPGQPAEIVAYGIPSAASMSYDSRRNRLLIPMNDWNAITIVDLD